MTGHAGPVVRFADPALVRALVARGWLGASGAGGGSPDTAAPPGEAPPDDPVRLGDVLLRPHQRDAVRRIRAALDEFGGALLADATGLGKTYVALALLARSERAVVVAPAALRDMWTDAMRRTGVARPLVTHESLSRGAVRGVEPPELVVVDEAHHARNPRTRRFRHLAALCAGARVLLLTATPIHNRTSELAAVLSLFLGERAGALDAADLARIVVRRDAHAAAGDPLHLPRVRTPVLLQPPHDERLLDRIVSLPPSVPPADGRDGGALVLLSLVRQWASSDGALAAALRRRLSRAAALESALEAGRHPTAAELRAWTTGDDAVQLAFPELLAAAAGTSALLAAVRAHAGAVRALLSAVDARLRACEGDAEVGDSSDLARARLLRDVRRRHPGARVVAFSAYADTVVALFRRLVELREPHVAVLSGDGALVAGGRLARCEALGRFAPRALGVPEPPEAERVTMLLSTDLLSEGVNLQDASVVVHLDLPWTAARLEQRVGRVARPGGATDEIAVYALAPPAGAESLLRVEERLRAKAALAGRSVGVVGAILPSLFPDRVGAASAPAAGEALRELLRGWCAAADAAPSDGGACAAEPVAAAVAAERAGFLALCRAGGDSHTLVASLDGVVTDDPSAVLAAASLAAGPARDGDVEPERIARALADVGRWARSRELSVDLGARRAARSSTRRELLARLSRILRRAPLHRRAAVEAMVGRGRAAATMRCGAGLERVLDELARSTLPDERWLRALGEFAALHAARPGSRSSGEGDDLRVVAIVLFGD